MLKHKTNKLGSEKREIGRTPKVLLWDVEISGIVATTWNLYPESIPHDNIMQDWFLISAAYKWLGESKIHTISLLDDPNRFKKNHTDDYYVAKKLRDVVDQADIIVAHNGDKFDTKVLNTRLIMNGIAPLAPVSSVDTLKEARKIAKFTSNRLDYLGKIFGSGGKMETPKGTWLRAMQGDKKAITTMVEYNKGDITVLESLYRTLLPYMRSHPHVGVAIGLIKDTSCPKCGSEDLLKDGFRMTNTGVVKQKMQCKSCGGYHTQSVK